MATITILPEAAAQAGCGISTDVIRSGPWPFDPEVFWSCSGEYAQRSITATFASLWGYCNVVVTCRHHGTDRQKRGGGQEGYIETPFDYTDTYGSISLFPGSETFTPSSVDDYSPPQATPFPARYVASGSYSWAWGGDSEAAALIKNDGVVEIVSIVATFIRRDLPHGPILCNRSGVLVCNHSGELLWH